MRIRFQWNYIPQICAASGACLLILPRTIMEVLGIGIFILIILDILILMYTIYSYKIYVSSEIYNSFTFRQKHGWFLESVWMSTGFVLLFFAGYCANIRWPI